MLLCERGVGAEMSPRLPTDNSHSGPLELDFEEVPGIMLRDQRGHFTGSAVPTDRPLDVEIPPAPWPLRKSQAEGKVAAQRPPSRHGGRDPGKEPVEDDFPTGMGETEAIIAAALLQALLKILSKHGCVVVVHG